MPRSPEAAWPVHVTCSLSSFSPHASPVATRACASALFSPSTFFNCLRRQRDVLANTMRICTISCPIARVPTRVPVHIMVDDKEGAER